VPDAPAPVFGPSRQLDYEAELGAFIGPGNRMGKPIRISEAGDQLFGLCLLNDWSARDIQGWEYQPLGPFLAKSFATSLSPWVVTQEALAPFRQPRPMRPAGDPSPLPYLDDPSDAANGAFGITIEVHLLTPAMHDAGAPPVRLSRADAANGLYWTMGQMMAHHTSNGCGLRPGDLIGSGTVSGDTPDSRGSLLELTRRGSEPLALPGGEQRGFLQDGDTVIMTARCERPGFASIGFGSCEGTIMGAAA
jgi:fumarylacetoacetase